jgi:chemotaxis protein CheD
VTMLAGRKVLIGLGNLHCSAEAGQLLIARPLGSTAALAVYEPNTGVGGLVHWMLPDSSLIPEREGRNPLLFADQAVPLLMAELSMLGVGRRAKLRAALAGAASLPEGGEYDVGKRNQEMAHKLIRKLRLSMVQEETGGVVVRDLGLEIGSGDFFIRRSYL